ncbi:UNVERIFIED_CONTAM: hypothetical protein FKN15_036361 [Acipenser sinensis]
MQNSQRCGESGTDASLARLRSGREEEGEGENPNNLHRSDKTHDEKNGINP